MLKYAFLLIVFLFPLYCLSQDKSFHRPDPQGIVDFLSGKINLSTEQKGKIKKAIEKKAAEFDKVNAKYLKKNEEIAAIKKEILPLESKMVEIYNSLPETVIAFLDDAQKAKFDELRKPKKKPEPPAVDKNNDKSENKISAKKKIKKIKRPPTSLTKPVTESIAENKEANASTPDKVKEQELDIFYP